MPGHDACEAGLCKRNEEVFSTAKHFVKVVSEPSVSMKSGEVFEASLGPLLPSFFKTVRSALTKVFPFPLPMFLTLFYPNPVPWH